MTTFKKRSIRSRSGSWPGQVQWWKHPMATLSQSMRGQLAEQCSIGSCEAAQVAEAMLLSHLRDAGGAAGWMAQGAMDGVKPEQPEEALRAHADTRLAGLAYEPVRLSKPTADFSDTPCAVRLRQ